MAFEKNSDLYKDPSLVEGRDYARRHRRHERFDDSLARGIDLPKTVVLAPTAAGSSGAPSSCAWPSPATTAQVVLVGGKDAVLGKHLLDGFRAAGVTVVDAAGNAEQVVL